MHITLTDAKYILSSTLLIATLFLTGGCWDSQEKPKTFTPVVWHIDIPISGYGLEEHEIVKDLIPFEDSDTRLMGYKDSQGHIKIPPKFSRAGDFTLYGWAEVFFANAGSPGSYRINWDGNILHQAYFVDNGADFFCSDRTRIVNLRKIGFANKKGETVIPPQYDWASLFSTTPPIAAICQGCYEVGIVLRKGEGRCNVAIGDCYTEYVGGKWGAIDHNGKIIVPLEYDKFKVAENNHLSFQKNEEDYMLLHDGAGHYQIRKQ